MTLIPSMVARWKSGHIIKEVIGRKLTYLQKDALMELAAAVWKADRTLRGLIIEAGCALGGSAIVIASIKKKETPFHVYDAFGMIPHPGHKDGQDVHDRYQTIRDGRASGLQEIPIMATKPTCWGECRKTFVHWGWCRRTKI